MRGAMEGEGWRQEEESSSPDCSSILSRLLVMVELKAPGSIFSFAALLRLGGARVGVACLLGVVWLPKGFPPSDEAWVSVTVVCDGVRAVTGVCDGVRVVIGPGLLTGDSRADNPCSADSHLLQVKV